MGKLLKILRRCQVLEIQGSMSRMLKIDENSIRGPRSVENEKMANHRVKKEVFSLKGNPKKLGVRSSTYVLGGGGYTIQPKRT